MRKRTLFVLGLLALTAACGGGGDEGDDVAPVPSSSEASSSARTTSSGSSTDTTPLPKGVWTILAKQLVEANDLQAALDTTREILARGGVATFDGDAVLVQAVGPAASFRASPQETMHMAMEARRRETAGTLTAAEFAQMLEGFGWPFPNARPQAAADVPLRGRPAPDAEAAMASAEREAREAEENRLNDAREAQEARVEAQQNASRAREQVLIEQLRDATLAWQKARQAFARARGDDKAAAQERMQQAADARTSLIEQRRVAQLETRAARDALRENVNHEDEEAQRWEQVQRRIGPDYANGEKLMEMFALWVRHAAEHPEDPRSFTPLFLAELARLQDAPVDLAGSRYQRPGRGAGAPVDLRGPPRSEQLRLTLLEIELIGAAFDRVRTAASVATSRPSSSMFAMVDFLLPPAQASTPCSDFKEMFGDLGSEVVGAAESYGIGEGLGRAVEAASDADTAGQFGKAMGAVSIAVKLAKLASFYANEQVSVTVDPRSVHKWVNHDTLVKFTAQAGISDEDRAEYDRIMSSRSSIDQAARDCYAFAGLPAFSDLVDMANEAENWVIEWRLTEASGAHAYSSHENNNYDWPGRRAMKMRRDTPYSAAADFFVDIRSEPKHEGKVVRAYVTAVASVDAAGMPGLGLLTSAGLGGPLGLADSLVELFSGWFQYSVQPKGWATVEVEYHCPRPYTLHRPSGGKAVADGAGSGDGPDECLIAAGKGE